jgi:hypothetical protein
LLDWPSRLRRLCGVLPVALVLTALVLEPLGPGAEYAVVPLTPGVEAHVVRVDANDSGVRQ